MTGILRGVLLVCAAPLVAVGTVVILVAVFCGLWRVGCDHEGSGGCEYCRDYRHHDGG